MKTMGIVHCYSGSADDALWLAEQGLYIGFAALTHTPVRADLAMTGEITLRGRVLPIGGLKEKTLAAKTAGIKTVLVPEKNRPDVEEIPAEIKNGLEILFVETMDDVIAHAFVSGKGNN